MLRHSVGYRFSPVFMKRIQNICHRMIFLMAYRIAVRWKTRWVGQMKEVCFKLSRSQFKFSLHEIWSYCMFAVNLSGVWIIQVIEMFDLCRGHWFSPVFVKLIQNIFLYDLFDDIPYWCSWIKNYVMEQTGEKNGFTLLRPQFKFSLQETWPESMSTLYLSGVWIIQVILD